MRVKLDVAETMHTLARPNWNVWLLIFLLNLVLLRFHILNVYLFNKRDLSFLHLWINFEDKTLGNMVLVVNHLVLLV